VKNIRIENIKEKKRKEIIIKKKNSEKNYNKTPSLLSLS